MNQTEKDKFFAEAFIAFPGLGDFIVNSPATLSVWSRTLAKVSFDDAMAVLDSWIDGSLPVPPVGYRRDMFALDVLACVQRKQSERNRHEKLEDYKTHDRENYRSPMKNYRVMGAAMNRINELVVMRDRGEITFSECDSRIDHVVTDGCKAIDEASKR